MDSFCTTCIQIYSSSSTTSSRSVFRPSFTTWLICLDFYCSSSLLSHPHHSQSSQKFSRKLVFNQWGLLFYLNRSRRFYELLQSTGDPIQVSLFASPVAQGARGRKRHTFYWYTISGYKCEIPCLSEIVRLFSWLEPHPFTLQQIYRFASASRRVSVEL